MKAVVTGATGYIGGRLVPQLLSKGYRVRCLARDPERLRGRDWTGEVEVVAGDVLDRGSLGPALASAAASDASLMQQAQKLDLVAQSLQGLSAFLAAVGRLRIGREPLDLDGVAAVRARLLAALAAAEAPAVLDLHRVTYLSSAGIGLLLDVFASALVPVTVSAEPDGPVARILALTGIRPAG